MDVRSIAQANMLLVLPTSAFFFSHLFFAALYHATMAMRYDRWHRVPQGHLQLSVSMNDVWFHGLFVHLQMPSVLSIPWPQWAMVCVVVSHCCSLFLMWWWWWWWCALFFFVRLFLHLLASVYFFLFYPFFLFLSFFFPLTIQIHPILVLVYTIHPRPRPQPHPHPTSHLTSHHWGSLLSLSLSPPCLSCFVTTRTHTCTHTLTLSHSHTVRLSPTRSLTSALDP